MAANIAFVVLVFLAIVIEFALGGANEGEASSNIKAQVFSKVKNNTRGADQKLLELNGDGGDTMTRIGATCSKDNILVFQGPTSPMPNGIPTYTVDIQNVCVSGSCIISNIHLSCGWFSSARLINPKLFKRIEYDDCLVNDGEPISPGQCLTFQYANTFPYPLQVSSVTCF